MLLSNWRAILMRAWSFRLIVSIALLQGLDYAMPYVGMALPLPDGWLTPVTIVIAVLAAFSRLVPQKGLSDG